MIGLANDRRRVGVVISQLGQTARGWQCIIAEAPNGTCWALIFDGMSFHEGPVVKARDEAEAGLVPLHDELEAIVERTQALAVVYGCCN